MTDHFAALAQPRRPWLDAETLRESFQRAAAQQHPDAPGGGDARFAALNSAHTVLREPAARLRHLLDLTAPGRTSVTASIPPALGDLFMELATLRSSLTRFREKEATAASALQRALLAGEKFALRSILDLALHRVTEAHNTALSELRALDGAWAADPTTVLDDLAALQARFAFLGKWSAQLREDRFQLNA